MVIPPQPRSFHFFCSPPWSRTKPHAGNNRLHKPTMLERNVESRVRLELTHRGFAGHSVTSSPTRYCKGQRSALSIRSPSEPTCMEYTPSMAFAEDEGIEPPNLAISSFQNCVLVHSDIFLLCDRQESNPYELGFNQPP